MILKLSASLPVADALSREQILEILQKEEYGVMPEKPFSVTGRTESRDPNYCAGKASLEHIRIFCHTSFGDFSFPVTGVFPLTGTKPAPAFVFLNFRPDVPDKYWPAEEIADRGYAVFMLYYQDITKDDPDFTDGLAGMLFPDGKRKSDDPGKIALWAWGAMRVMDYATERADIDSSHVSVIGHSRLGKTALLAGASDQRFFCAISNDSGAGGAALYRGKTGETAADLIRVFPYWFCEKFKDYSGQEEDMPFDQHFLIDANCPHRVYVSSASGDSWSDPDQEYLSLKAADSYYRSHHLPGFIHLNRDPITGDAYQEGYLGYHRREGLHYLSREDWNLFLSYLDVQMNKNKL